MGAQPVPELKLWGIHGHPSDLLHIKLSSYVSNAASPWSIEAGLHVLIVPWKRTLVQGRDLISLPAASFTGAFLFHSLMW